ncbi:MAG: hypothetical protein O3B08_09435, partial [Proteobacteria bacterium]|nr:hypothetical protein [Pseudomonadota bacterium]
MLVVSLDHPVSPGSLLRVWAGVSGGHLFAVNRRRLLRCLTGKRCKQIVAENKNSERPGRKFMPDRGSGKKAEHISAAAAARLVKSGDWIDYGITLSQPDVFDKALAARKAELRNVKFRSCITMKP